MTTSDKVDNESPKRPFLAQVLLYLGAAGTPGALASLIAIGIEDGFDWVLIAVGLLFAVGGFALVRYALRIGNFDPPNLSSKTGINQVILLSSAGIGLAVGLYFNLSGRVDDVLQGTFVLTQTEALTGLIILFGFMPIAIFWHRIADEHEAAAANSSAMIALYVYLYGYLGWTFAEYAGLLPAMNSLILFSIVLFTFSGFWAFRRS